ncbi:ethylbenzene dehydrogenase-related protein [Anderseniella sp. Alg231-50]|uniref:ethylbenzene dehydrogenase-related protein n=1 Tax=Anderseniella sp. Alg231-50 TaxID=1922226 RepID=UPI00307BCCDC
MKITAIADYAATTAAGWQQVATETVEMVPAPVEMQPNGFIQANWQDRAYGQLSSLEAQSVHDGTSIAVRLRWASEKPETGGREGFPDGAAIAFPITGEPVLWTMGNEDEPVQFIQWQAMKNKIRSVVAWGIGSSVPGTAVSESVTAGWSQGYWTIVMLRTLAGGPEAATLKPGSGTKIGFAVWNGSNEERAGIKAVSVDWSPLTIEA